MGKGSLFRCVYIIYVAFKKVHLYTNLFTKFLELTTSCMFSDFLPPQINLLLFKVATFLFVDQDQIEYVFAAESIINVCVAGCQIGGRKIKAHGDQFSFDWRAVHNFELGASFLLGDGICARPHRFLPYD